MQNPTNQNYLISNCFYFKQIYRCIITALDLWLPNLSGLFLFSLSALQSNRAISIIFFLHGTWIPCWIGHCLWAKKKEHSLKGLSCNFSVFVPLEVLLQSFLSSPVSGRGSTFQNMYVPRSILLLFRCLIE